jgi:signal transduction histidine kinase
MGLTARPGRRALALDGLLAVLLAMVMLFGTQRAATAQPLRHPLDAAATGLLLAAAIAVAARRLAPLPALTLATLAAAVYLGIGYPYGPVFLAPVILLYTVGAHEPLGRSLPAAAAAILLLALSEVPRTGLRAGAFMDLLMLVPWHIWFLVPWAVGAGLRGRRETGRRGREEEARRLAYEERLRIAREVHDVVGHGLAVINMQAGIALHVVDRRPEQARVALEAIKQTSKDALDELRATLAVFRQPDAPREPAPGLAQLDTVVGAMAEGGLPVDVVVTGEPVPLPAAVDHAAYRIVQESLTNVARHAGPAAATVRVGYEPRHVVLEITDDGRGRAGGGTGHGIAGMRERAAAVHGSLEAGPRPEGGFRVLARLPSGGSRP